jgi:hypothetical protein
VICPSCGLVTQRFLDLCRNDGYKLWPSSEVASAAFKAWRDADPARADASRYDLELPPPVGVPEIDFVERAHQLGIHLFPNSNYPIIICVGFLFLGLAAIPFGSTTRLVLLVIGGLIFLYGVVGWVLVEDVQLYAISAGTDAHGEVDH